MDTRIKAGTLNITYSLPWTVYTGNKSKIIYSSSLPKKIRFPKGVYQLEINGLFHQIEIKDGQTLEYDSSIRLTQPPKLNIDTNKIAPIQKSNISDSGNIETIKHEVSNNLPNEKNWEIEPNVSAKSATGKILIKIPKEVECIISISQPNTGKELFYSGALTNARTFSLAPGTFDVKISGSTIKNVPVQKGMNTRIKAGILNVTASEIWTLYDENKNKQIYFSATAKRIGLPAGNYQLEIHRNTKQIIIKDGEILAIL